MESGVSDGESCLLCNSNEMNDFSIFSNSAKYSYILSIS